MGAMKKSKILNRAVTRDLPLFMISASYGVYLRELSKNTLGFSLSQSFVLLDRGTAIIHRDNDEWFGAMPELWAVALQDKKRSDAIREFIRLTNQSIHKLDSIKLAPSTSCLIELRQVIADGVAGMIFAHWIPIYNEQKLAAYALEDVAYFEKARKEIEKFFSLAAEVAYSFLAILSAKHVIDTALLKYATDDELHSLLISSKINIANLKKRKAKKLLFVEDVTYIGDDDINTYLNSIGYVFDVPSDELTASIQGSVACRGVVTGRVQIINSREQFDSFKEGSILVAPMTSPEYTPLIHRAVAIITDEGGMLSHAAIVSRELNKPCIIGTKFASYVLKDFQEVEVDADRGVISILR